MVPPYFTVEKLEKAGGFANGCQGKALMARVEDRPPTETQARQRGHHPGKIRNPLALGTGSQLPGFFLLFLGAQGFHKERWIGCHPLAGDGGSGLVVGEKGGKVPGGDVLTANPTAERCSMIGVGARQGRQDTGCGPA